MRSTLLPYRTRRAIRLAFSRMGLGDAPRVRMEISELDLAPSDIVIERHGDEILLLANPQGNADAANSIKKRSCAMLYWFLASPDHVKRLVANTSDGDRPTLASVAFSTPCPALAWFLTSISLKNKAIRSSARLRKMRPIGTSAAMTSPGAGRPPGTGCYLRMMH